MKMANKTISLILSFIIILTLINYEDVKVKALGSKLGYVIVEYLDTSGNRIIPTQTATVDLAIYNTWTLSVYDMTVSSYTFDISGMTSSGYTDSSGYFQPIVYATSPVSINVNNTNTLANPVHVTLYYTKNSTDIPVYIASVVKTPNLPDAYYNEDNETVGSTGKTIKYNVDTSSTSQYGTYKSCLIQYEYTLGNPVAATGSPGVMGSDGTIHLNPPPSGVQKVDCFYYFDKDTIDKMDMSIVVIDNFIDPDTGKATLGPDGRDYFGRKDMPTKPYDRNESIYVISPMKGMLNGTQLILSKVVYEKLQGNPENALLAVNQYPPVIYGQTLTGPDFNATFHAQTDRATQYIHYYWEYKGTPVTPPDSGGDGKIVFDPNKTPWTNAGKISNGSGSYPVNVKYVGNNPVVLQGNVTIHHDEPVPPSPGPDGTSIPNPNIVFDKTVTFPVNYNIQNITVTGDANTVINGANGNVNITKQGANLKLHGVGAWKTPVEGTDYTLPTPEQYESITNKVIPPEPSKPTGDSGIYKLDWTNPVCSFNVTSGIFSEARGAVRKQSLLGTNFAFFGTLTCSDYLSGCASIQYSFTFGSSDKGNYTEIYSSSYTDFDRASEVIPKEIEKPVGDNLYLHVKLLDIAGNTNYQIFGPFEDPIKLKNFEVTDICDPNWSSIFWTDDTFTTPTRNVYPVLKLPVDNKSNPIYTNAEIKKGYAFNFDITSEFMYRAADKIQIKPSFYYWDGTTRTPVDLYYTLYDNPFTKVGSIEDTLVMNLMVNGKPKYYIGGLSLLTLNKDVRLLNGRKYSDWKGGIQYTDGKEQYWYGEYFIPGNSIFVPKGKTPRPENVLENNWIIINFDIVGNKYGAETLGTDQTFYYNPSQWQVENGPKNNDYQNGDVIVYDNAHNVFMDYDTNVTH